MEHRNTNEIHQIQTAQENLQSTLVSARSKREAAEKEYYAITQEIETLKAADDARKEDRSIKDKLRSAHTSLEQALISQESHLHALLEVHFCFLDLMHLSHRLISQGNHLHTLLWSISIVPLSCASVREKNALLTPPAVWFFPLSPSTPLILSSLSRSVNDSLTR